MKRTFYAAAMTATVRQASGDERMTDPRPTLRTVGPIRTPGFAPSKEALMRGAGASGEFQRSIEPKEKIIAR